MSGVDVVGVMRRDARGFEDLNFLHPSRPVFRQQSDEAIAAVAELMEAADELIACVDTIAVEEGLTEYDSQRLEELRAALARCKVEK